MAAVDGTGRFRLSGLLPVPHEIAADLVRDRFA